jgi:hypothetical protein
MSRFTVHNQDELAMSIHREAGVPRPLAGEFASRASCGEIVRFTVQTEVIGYQPSGRHYSLTEVTITWEAEASDAWELRKVEEI